MHIRIQLTRRLLFYVLYNWFIRSAEQLSGLLGARIFLLLRIRTSYLEGLNLILGLQRTTTKVWRKWLLMQAGEKGVLSASRNTIHTMSLPMWRLRWSWNEKKCQLRKKQCHEVRIRTSWPPLIRREVKGKLELLISNCCDILWDFLILRRFINQIYWPVFWSELVLPFMSAYLNVNF